MDKVLERLDKPSESTNLNIKPAEVHLFKPTSRRDDRAARLLIERIRAAMLTYKDQLPKLDLLLSRCLNNEIAQF